MFFGQYRYPEVNAEGKIDLFLFLEASRGIEKFVELLGTAFYPVKNDIHGNIEKLLKIYNMDKEKFKYVNNIVESEINLEEEEKIGIDALLWLKRALEYIQVFLTCFVEDYQEKKNTEDLTPYFKKAYELKLKPYHGWFVQQLFALCIKVAPFRKDLIKLLGTGMENFNEEIIMNDIEEFLNSLNSNLEIIVAMYDENNLNSTKVV
ncbi:glycolipid transfer protein-like [Centruroides sculpturatus]|uniref:glycolipid transfer protein-like n=1 Tax=Centruroides sculpturatus TaxID=218467 RepID=UPI000C6D5E39|nr:glycolipid transfer protein-like [Centruroides sculpturatus]